MDKDGLWLDSLEEKVHHDWTCGLITNMMRSKMLIQIKELRDWL